MTPQDPQNPEDGDNFDRLLANRSQIAEFVNSFTSERVQRKAFEAVVCSLGLSDETAGSQAPAPVEHLRVVHPPNGRDAVETDEATDTSETQDANDGNSNGRRRKNRSGAKKNFTVTRGLNFAPEGKPTFEAFIAEKKPRTNDEKILVSCHYLTEMMSIPEVSVGHVLAAFQAAEWSPPAHPDTALRACASRTGWIDTANSKAITVVWKGQNHLANKMPAETKTKSS